MLRNQIAACASDAVSSGKFLHICRKIQYKICFVFIPVKFITVDPAHFFDAEIIKVATQLAESGRRVVLAGLDTDRKGQPFGPMPDLLAVAEFVTKVHAICAETGELASFSFRLDANNSQVMLGEKDAYEARSRQSFFNDMKNRNK